MVVSVPSEQPLLRLCWGGVWEMDLQRVGGIAHTPLQPPETAVLSSASLGNALMDDSTFSSDLETFLSLTKAAFCFS